MKNIIIVDMQKGFINENNKHIVEKINNYIATNNFDNIFVTKCINDDKSPYTKILNWNGVTKKEEQDIICNTPLRAKILTKNCYGITNDYIKLFKDLGITEMEICGTDTDACCLAIAFNLFDNNIRPIILSSLCASSSRNNEIHNYALEIMRRQFGNDSVR